MMSTVSFHHFNQTKTGLRLQKTCLGQLGRSSSRCLDGTCHGTTSPPPLRPPLATSNCIHIHFTSSASTPLQLQCILAQLVQLCHACSQTNHSVGRIIIHYRTHLLSPVQRAR